MYTQVSISKLGQLSRQTKKNYNILQRFITKHQRKSCPTTVDATKARTEFRSEANNLLRLLSELEKIRPSVTINYDHLDKYVSRLSNEVAFPNELNSLQNIVNLIREGGFTRVFGILVSRISNLQVKFSEISYSKNDLADLNSEQIQSLRKDLLLFGKEVNDLIFNIQTIAKILNYSQKQVLLTKASVRNFSKAA